MDTSKKVKKGKKNKKNKKNKDLSAQVEAQDNGQTVQDTGPAVLTVDEFANRFGANVSKMTVRALVKAGRIKGFQLSVKENPQGGARYVIPSSELHEFPMREAQRRYDETNG